ncbi:MAG: T9SS type A sorting domain-containing protein [Bacteroidia bacterium]
MKHLYSCVVLAFVSLNSYSQNTIPFSDDFEGSLNWTIVNGTETNKWFVDTAIYASSNHSIYISNTNGSTNTYDENSISVTHFYSDFIVPLSGCIQLEFDWQCGAGGSDGMQTWIVPLSYMPQAGIIPVSGSGIYPVGFLISGLPNFQHVVIDLRAVPNDTIRLLFTWFNDDFPGAQPPAAIDNISITAQPGPPNDYPCNAIPLSFGSWIAGNDSCSGYYDEPAPPPCFIAVPAMNLQTVWYSFIAPPSGCVRIKTRGSTIAGKHIGLYGGVSTPVMCDSGATLNYIACSNTSPACGSLMLPAELSVDSLIPGLIYYIMLDGGGASTGSFYIMIIDGGANCQNPFPPLYGQDCDVPIPACTDSIIIPNPGFIGTGTACDFTTGYCLAAGERGAGWFKITIAQAGQLMFDIVYNNYPIGPAADYDFIIWRMDSAGGSVSCQQLANDTIPPAACNFNFQPVTGCYIGGNSPPAYPGFDTGYEPPVAVLPGEVYYLVVTNFTMSGTGFKLSFLNTPPGVIAPCGVSVSEIPADNFYFTLQPNPVTNQSVIKYSLLSKTFVQMDVVNVLGQKVKSFAGELKNSGMHYFTISKPDFNEGIYLVQITVNGKTYVTRMVVN